MELTKVKLSDVARVEISGVDKKSKPGEKSVRLCNFVDVYHNWAITQDMRDSFMEATASDKEIEALSIKKGQVAFTKDSETRMDIGIPTYIADNFDDIVLGYHNALITPDERKLNGKYLNAFMHSSYIQKYFENNASGSGQRYTLSNDTVNSIPILLPTIKEQEKIGNLFSFIDRKIALNKKMNQKLEAMAKRLYDYWFVQFDFPDKNGHPYKTTGGPMTYNPTLKREIPVGWEVRTIGDYLKIGNGRDHSKLADGPYPVYGSGGIMRYVAEFLHDGETVLFPRKGTLNNVMYRNEPLWTVDTMFYTSVLVPHSALFVFYSAKMFDFERLNTGTGVPSMTSDIIKKLPIISPDKQILEQFDRTVVKLYNQIHHNEKEISRLTKLRDKLLPLLMNGQVVI